MKHWYSTAKLAIQAAFVCDTDLVIKICRIMIAITNTGNLQQYEGEIFFDCRADNGARLKP